MGFMFQINVLCFRYMYYVSDICIVFCTYGPPYVRTRLIILTGGNNSHKIKIAETGQLAVGIRPLDCKYTFYHFRNTEQIDYL